MEPPRIVEVNLLEKIIMVGKDNLIHLPELSMSFPSLRKHLSELYNITINTMAHSQKVRELYDKAYHLFNNYIGNKGKLDYSDKQYGYLVDELEDVEVGYFKDESVDSEYAERLRDKGFTMTEQEAIDTLQHRIESIEEEVGPVQYANGGALNSDEMDRYNELTQKMKSYLEGGTKMSSKEIAEYSKLKHKRNMGSSEEYRKQMDWEKSVEGRYEYAKGGGVGSSKTYKLRAEGLNDFLAFLQAGMYMRIKSFTIQPIGVPDVVVTFETDASLSEIKSKLREVPDSHVMLQTVKPINEYTGERDEEYAEGGGVGDKVRELKQKSSGFFPNISPNSETSYYLWETPNSKKVSFIIEARSVYNDVGSHFYVYDKEYKYTGSANSINGFYDVKPVKITKQYAEGGGVGEYAESKFDSSVAKLREYIRKYPYIWTKNGKEYVPIEGWQFAGLILGYSTRVTEVTPTANGYMAKAEVVDAYNNVVCSGFGLVDKSESKWSGKPEYQLVGFAQTRAVSRALRNCYRDWETTTSDRKSTRLNSSHSAKSRMPSSA